MSDDFRGAERIPQGDMHAQSPLASSFFRDCQKGRKTSDFNILRLPVDFENLQAETAHLQLVHPHCWLYLGREWTEQCCKIVSKT